MLPVCANLPVKRLGLLEIIETGLVLAVIISQPTAVEQTVGPEAAKFELGKGFSGGLHGGGRGGELAGLLVDLAQSKLALRLPEG